MKAILRATAQALMETCKDLPDDAVMEACDAALQILERSGVTARERSQFLDVVRWLVQENEPFRVSMTTPTGSVGEHARGLSHALETALERNIMLEERADPTLVGGALLRVGDDAYDASFLGALRTLERQLAAP